MTERIHKPSRPHLIRAALAGVIALGGLVAADFGQLTSQRDDPATVDEKTLALAGAGLLLIAGIAVVRTLSHAARATMDHRVGASRSAPLGLAVSVAGYVLLILTVLTSLGLQDQIQGLLVGGAVTGVAVGIAAQQTLGNFFAGLVLLIVHPFAVGDYVVLRSGLGEYEGTVTNIGMFYVHVATSRGEVALPNTGVLGSAVGPGARSSDPKEDASAPDGSIAGDQPVPPAPRRTRKTPAPRRTK